MFDEFKHTAALPLIVAGCAGTLVIVTAKVCAADEPHELFATTVMFPPALPTVAVMELAETPLAIKPDLAAFALQSDSF